MTPPRPPRTSCPAWDPSPLGSSPDSSLPFYLFSFGGATKSVAPHSLQARAGARCAGSEKGAVPMRPQPFPVPSSLRPNSAPWGQFLGPARWGCKRRAGRGARSAPGGLRDTPLGCLVPPLSLLLQRWGLCLFYNEICSKPPDGAPAWVGPAWAQRWGQPRGGLPRETEQVPAAPGGGPSWGPGRCGTPDVPEPCPARPPFCRMCLRPLFRF